MTDYFFLVSLLIYNISSFLFTLLQVPTLDFTEYQKYGLIGVIVVQNIIIFLLVYFLYKVKKDDPNSRLVETILSLAKKKGVKDAE